MRTRIFYYNIAAILLFIILLFGIGFFLKLNNQVVNYKTISKNTRFINQSFLKFTHLQFAFFHTKDTLYEKEFSLFLDKFYKVMNQSLQKEFFTFTIDISKNLSRLLDANELSEYKKLKSIVREYIHTIEKVFEYQNILGLDHHHGLYGHLREKVHLLEERLKVYHDQKLLISMLTMRRHEKDFMLRGLPEYVTKLHNQMDLFQTALIESSYKDKFELKTYAEHYLQSFDSFVTFYNLLGYGKVSGLIQHSQLLRDSFAQTLQVVNRQLATKIQPYEYDINVVTIAMIADAILLVILIMLSRRELEHAKERNPVSGLNGNNRITEHLKKLSNFNKNRTIIYFDFDYFKPFNDRFGFKNGDKVILDFSRMLKETFDMKHNFIGHIGGDDFVVMLYKSTFSEALECVKTVQNTFYKSCLSFYEPQEIAQGFIYQKDRFGDKRQLPLIRVSASIIQIPKHVELYDPNVIPQIFSSLKSSSKEQTIASVSLI